MSTKPNPRQSGLSHCDSMSCGTCLEGSDDPVGHLAPDWTPAGVVPGGVDPIAQEYDGEAAVRVDPDRGAGESGVAKGVFRKAIPGAASFRRCVPAQRSAGAGHQSLPPGELGENAR